MGNEKTDEIQSDPQGAVTASLHVCLVLVVMPNADGSLFVVLPVLLIKQARLFACVLPVLLIKQARLFCVCVAVVVAACACARVIYDQTHFACAERLAVIKQTVSLFIRVLMSAHSFVSLVQDGSRWSSGRLA